jgi:Ni,Fe-hydrogenase I cytochrome b subunit
MSSEQDNEKEALKKINKSKYTAMWILGLTGAALIFTGFFIGQFFDFINIKVSKTMFYVFKIAFYGSGFFDFWLVNYMRQKL